MYFPEPTAGDTSWFTRDRFGLFIHWGTYAAAARHEWVQSREKIAPDQYRKYFEHFDPDLYDPTAWARAARQAGMKYMVVTTKHHEGFCLWDSKYTEFKAPNSAAGRDLLTPLVEAFRAEGLRIGFYYSLLDWNHPQFPIDIYHPLRDHPEADAMNEQRDVAVYAAYMRDQVRELLTDFGEIDILWFDYSYPWGKWHDKPGKGRDDWQSEELMQLIRSLAPTVMVNNRLDLPDVPADMHTPEQYQPARWVQVDGKPVVWETCQTLSGSWGYHRDESSWKSAGQLIRMLIESVATGGNLLMNVGPTARGVFDSRALGALATYGAWMHWCERSIYGCTQAQLVAPPNVRYTQNYETGRLYAHLFSWPFQHLYLPGLADKVDYAQFLHDGSEIAIGPTEGISMEEMGLAADTLALVLPVAAPDLTVPVIELFLK